MQQKSGSRATRIRGDRDFDMCRFFHVHPHRSRYGVLPRHSYSASGHGLDLLRRRLVLVWAADSGLLKPEALLGGSFRQCPKPKSRGFGFRV